MFNMKLFIDTDADSRLAKRVLKDVDELGRDMEQVSTVVHYSTVQYSDMEQLLHQYISTQYSTV